MTAESPQPSGPDLGQGIALDELAAGVPVFGHVGDQAALLVRLGGDVLAVAATCTHYGGPLAEGLRRRRHGALPVAPRLLQPAHRRGAARAGAGPARVLAGRAARRHGRSCAKACRPEPARRWRAAPALPGSVVIVGGGAAGHAAAEMLRREGYAGRVTLLSADDGAARAIGRTCRRTISPATRRRTGFRCARRSSTPSTRIELRLGTRVAAIDPAQRARDAVGRQPTLGYDALLLATGAEPVRLGDPGRRRCRTCTSCARSPTAAPSIARPPTAQARRGDRRQLHRPRGRGVAARARARGARRRARDPCRSSASWGRSSATSCARCTRSTASSSISAQTADVRSTAERARWRAASALAADLVVIGVGVRPRDRAGRAGRPRDRSRRAGRRIPARPARPASSPPATSRAGPIRARGERIRVEHWVVAERQGQVAARNMLGQRERFDAVPFFWSQHYDVDDQLRRPRRAVGRGRDRRRSRRARLHRELLAGGRTLAVATVGRDRASLDAELAFEQEAAA